MQASQWEPEVLTTMAQPHRAGWRGGEALAGRAADKTVTTPSSVLLPSDQH